MIPAGLLDVGFWWFKPATGDTTPQVVPVTWSSTWNSLKVTFKGRTYKVTSLVGDWEGPLQVPARWESAHAVMDSSFDDAAVVCQGDVKSVATAVSQKSYARPKFWS